MIFRKGLNKIKNLLQPTNTKFKTFEASKYISNSEKIKIIFSNLFLVIQTHAIFEQQFLEKINCDFYYNKQPRSKMN